jgi:hypothetical protein
LDQWSFEIFGSSPRYQRWLHWLRVRPLPTNFEIDVQFSMPFR